MDIKEEFEEFEEEVKKRNPIWTIIGLAIILIFLASLIPYWAITADPRPSYTPTIAEVLPDGFTYERVEAATYSNYVIVDSEIKGVADRIAIKACNSGETICHAKVMFYFVRDNFEYVSDPTAFEYIKSPHESLVNQGGDCDDASVLLSSLLESVGISTRLVFVPGHVYVEAWIPKAPNRYKSERDWVPLDATCSDCEFGEVVWKYNDAERRYS